jgi:hypothetical protein
MVIQLFRQRQRNLSLESLTLIFKFLEQIQEMVTWPLEAQDFVFLQQVRAMVA